VEHSHDALIEEPVGLVALHIRACNIYGRVTYTGDIIIIFRHAFYTTSHDVTVLVITKYVQRKSSEQNSETVLVNLLDYCAV